MGFDHLGRDLFSRVIYGSRVALIVGIAATFISVFIGVIIGSTAGYFGGWVDNILSRIIDTLMAFPIIALLTDVTQLQGQDARVLADTEHQRRAAGQRDTSGS